MGKRGTIDDVEYVADAVILGHLRAALVNIDHAVKDFKRHHYESKKTDFSSKFLWLRSLTKDVLEHFVVLCNEKVQGHRLERERKKMEGRWHRRVRVWAKT